MIIKEATEKDVPEILTVLKASLGEVSSKKTEDVWNYKHKHNPFGKSLVLVACEKNRIVGVRAFMRWKWNKDGKVIEAFRAVDTATHPEHQGKGIFKKLTRAALDIAEKSGDHIVFNTPNKQSKPGYIKMGWEEVGKINIQLIPVNPIYWFSFFKTSYNSSINNTSRSLNRLLENYNQKCLNTGKLFTPKNFEFLKWRYIENKLQSYFVSNDEDHFIAAYIKNRGKLSELRICEAIYCNNSGKRKSKRFIKQLLKSHESHFISYNNLFNDCFRTQFGGRFGPVLTVKNINLNSQMYKEFMELENWNYSIGDLELF